MKNEQKKNEERMKKEQRKNRVSLLHLLFPYENRNGNEANDFKKEKKVMELLWFGLEFEIKRKKEEKNC